MAGCMLPAGSFSMALVDIALSMRQVAKLGGDESLGSLYRCGHGYIGLSCPACSGR